MPNVVHVDFETRDPDRPYDMIVTINGKTYVMDYKTYVQLHADDQLKLYKLAARTDEQAP